MIRPFVAAVAATALTAIGPVGPATAAHTRTCSPCTYVVNPNGTNARSLPYVLANLVHAGDTVELADGVYPVANMTLAAPNVTIRAQHLPAAGASPSAWLDGSIPYRWWNQPSPRIWTHAYSKDFCNTTLLHHACAGLGVAFHADQVFKGDVSIPQTLSASDLAGSLPVFYVDSVHHLLELNFDPGADTTVTDKETALVFDPSATYSKLEGIGVRRYAGNDHDASALAAHADTAVYIDEATGVQLVDDYFSFNGIRGVKVQGNVPPAQTPVAGSNVVINGSTFDHNGELGLDTVDSDAIVVAHSLFYKNNLKHYYEGFEAGGAKLLSTWYAHIADNVFEDTIGIGLWFDRSSYDALIARNLFKNNTWHGLQYEVSARATVTGNVAIANHRAGLLVWESSQVSLSHNYFRGNLVGIGVMEWNRTWANNPANHDSDPDRIHPPDLTFDVADIDIHSNGFYYAPSGPTYAVCDPSTTVQAMFDGCQYQIALEDLALQRDASVLGVTPQLDHFHRDGWPSDPLHAPVPVFIALWQARPETATPNGCVSGPSSSRQLRWVTLADFECAGQEHDATTPFARIP